jgi:hypothetical protein
MEEPRGSRTLLIASLVTVLLSGVAGYAVWWLAHRDAGGSGVPSPGGEADLASISLRPVPHSAGTLSDERQRVDALIEGVVFETGPKAGEDRGAAEQLLVAQGELAIPRLLDAFHRLYAEDGFAEPKSRARAGVVDRVLRLIRRGLRASTPLFGEPLAGSEPPAVVERRAKAWMLWWQIRTSGPR